MASITSWVRIEPRSRDRDLLAGVEARLHDPLWLIARQWQLGELTGTDTGSAIVASTEVEVARIDATRVRGGDWRPFDPDTTPLSTMFAPAAGEPRARPDLDRRARSGRQLARTIAAVSPDDAGLFAAKFPLAVTPTERAMLDDADLRFLAVMAARVPDGDAAAAALAPVLADPAAQLPGDFGVPSARIARVSGACRAWLATIAPVAPTSWRPEELAYRFDARVAAGARDIVLAADHHTSGTIHAYDVDATPGDASQRPPVSITSTSLPARVRYRGMPARRYWELEDAAVHWPSIDAGPGDLARILFVEFGLRFADHWLVVPIEVAAGSLSRVSSLVVTDTFGQHILVRAASDLDGGRAWHFVEVSRTGDLAGPLVFVPPAASEAVGSIRGAVDIARDDVSDVMWGVERAVIGADGRTRDVAIGSPPVSSVAVATYRLGPEIDPAYHPYRLRVDHDGPVLALAAIPGRAASARGDLPARLRSHALPAGASRVATRQLVARSADGAYHVVEIRERSAVAPPPAPLLRFDAVEEPP